MNVSSTRRSLADEELIALLRQEQIEVSPSSQLAGVANPAAGLSHKPAHRDRGDELLLAAVRAVAQPTVELGLLMPPPFQPELQWHYLEQSGSAPLIAYDRTGSGQHLFALADPDDLLERLRSCLRLRVPAPPGELNLQLTGTGYQTLLGLVDCVRERTLEALLRRESTLDEQFTAPSICAAFARSAASGDMRWLAAIARAVSPLNPALNESQSRDGLNELAQSELIELRGDGNRLKPTLREACIAMSSPLAFGAIHLRQFAAAGPPEQEYIWAVRTLGGLWLVHFPASRLAPSSARIRSVTTAELELVFAEKLRLAVTRSPHSPIATSTPQPTTQPPPLPHTQPALTASEPPPLPVPSALAQTANVPPAAP